MSRQERQSWGLMQVHIIAEWITRPANRYSLIGRCISSNRLVSFKSVCLVTI